MPLFIGAVWKNIDTQRANELSKLFSKIAKKNTNKEITNIISDFWLISAAQRTYETDQEKIVVFPEREGMGLGRFYSKANDESSLINRKYKYVSSTAGKLLSQNYWGRHVLIIANNKTQTLSIYRDAMGLSQVYFANFHEILFFSSDLYLLIKSIPKEISNLELNWEYFSSFLACGLLHTSTTPFKDISELLPGCFLTYENKNLSIKPFWDPTTLPIKKGEDGKNLISIFNNCVRKWTENSPEICLQLSGGLDSSALYMSLENSLKKDQKPIIVNYLNKFVASSDESEYAKILIEGSNLKLTTHEQHYTPKFFKTSQWNRPYPAILEMNSKTSLLEKINSKNVEFISGHGGDHLFLAKVDSAFLTDYLLQIGFKGFLNKLKHAALINRTPALPYLYNIMADLYTYFLKKENRKSDDYFLLKKDWFTEELQDLINTKIYLSPFEDNLSKIYPGKALHILQIYHASADIGLELPGVTEIYPFLSQPLVEESLGIPTYESFNEHWSRFHFRKAVSNYFKTDLVWRQSKGEISGVMQLCIRENLHRIEELCLEGKFAQHNLIHKDLLRKHISLLANGQIDEQWLVTRLLAAELWFDNCYAC